MHTDAESEKLGMLSLVVHVRVAEWVAQLRLNLEVADSKPCIVRQFNASDSLLWGAVSFSEMINAISSSIKGVGDIHV